MRQSNLNPSSYKHPKSCFDWRIALDRLIHRGLSMTLLLMPKEIHFRQEGRRGELSSSHWGVGWSLRCWDAERWEVVPGGFRWTQRLNRWCCGMSWAWLGIQAPTPCITQLASIWGLLCLWIVTITQCQVTCMITFSGLCFNEWVSYFLKITLPVLESVFNKGSDEMERLGALESSGLQSGICLKILGGKLL